MERINKIAMALFLTCLIGFTALWFFCAPEKQEANHENRSVSKAPALTASNIEAFPGQFEKYYNDTLPFRDQLIQFYALAQLKIFGEVESEKLVFGEDGWLYYYNNSDGNTIQNYKRTDLFTQSELEQIANHLNRMKQSVEAAGSRFVLFLTPNKETAVPEYMPKHIKISNQEKGIDQLIQYLRTNTDITVVYPLKELESAKLIAPIYYQLDSHWNSFGAYVGWSALADTLGVQHVKPESVHVEQKPVKTGDLSRMAGVEGYIEDRAATVVSGYTDHKAEVVEDDSVTQFKRYRSNAVNSGKIMIAHDSFSIGLMDYVGNSFQESVFCHRHAFQDERFYKEKPDIFVYQIVERYMRNMIELKNFQ